jgi:hypothetical protein
VRVALLGVSLLTLVACNFDSGVPAGVNNGVGPNLGDGAVPGGDGADNDAGPPTECTGQPEGSSCSVGICLGGECLTSDTTELKGSNLTIFESDSTLTDLLANSLDEDRFSRWPTDPDILPRFISFKLEQPHYLTGVHVDAGTWTHCGQSDIFVSSDGQNWGSAVASYSELNPLPTNAPAYFDAPTLGEYIKIVVNKGEVVNPGESPRGYCYISIFRAIAVGL